MTTENDVRNRGYQLHEELADLLNQPRYQSGYSCSIPVVMDDGSLVTLRHTTNAGFRGIEGWFEPHRGKPFTRNLGHVKVFNPEPKQGELLA